jgi:hypothetical protein
MLRQASADVGADVVVDVVMMMEEEEDSKQPAIPQV